MYPVLKRGVTDSVAANYNSDAENDDGSCVFDIVGVWTPNSIDYDISVTAILAGQTILWTHHIHQHLRIHHGILKATWSSHLQEQ